MSDDPQTSGQTPAQAPEAQAAEHHRRISMPNGMIDPRNYDPRKALDSAAVERVLKAQAAARERAAASTAVFIGTIVTLVTSAFGLAAALAWNSAISSWINDLSKGPLAQFNLSGTAKLVVQALLITILAIIAVVILNRIAGRYAKKNAFKASVD